METLRNFTEKELGLKKTQTFIVKFLSKHKHAFIPHKRKFVSWAATNGNLELYSSLFRFLLDPRKDKRYPAIHVEPRSYFKEYKMNLFWTSVTEIVQNNHLNMIDFLLEQNLHVELLYMSIIHNNMNFVKRILMVDIYLIITSYKKTVQLVTSNIRVIMELIVWYNRMDMFDLLFNHIEYRHDVGNTSYDLIEIAAETGNIYIFTELEDWFTLFKSENDVLIKALVHNNFKLAEYLIEKYNFTLNFLYEIIENEASVHFYVKHGGDIQDHRAMDYCLYKNKVDTLKLLLENGLKIKLRSYSFANACEMGYIKLIKVLVDHGFSIHSFNDTCIQIASIVGNLELVKYFLSLSNPEEYKTIILRNAIAKNRLSIVLFVFNEFKIYLTKDEVVKYLQDTSEKGYWSLFILFESLYSQRYNLYEGIQVLIKLARNRQEYHTLVYYLHSILNHTITDCSNYLYDPNALFNVLTYL